MNGPLIKPYLRKESSKQWGHTYDDTMCKFFGRFGLKNYYFERTLEVNSWNTQDYSDVTPGCYLLEWSKDESPVGFPSIDVTYLLCKSKTRIVFPDTIQPIWVILDSTVSDHSFNWSRVEAFYSSSDKLPSGFRDSKVEYFWFTAKFSDWDVDKFPPTLRVVSFGEGNIDFNVKRFVLEYFIIHRRSIFILAERKTATDLIGSNEFGSLLRSSRFRESSLDVNRLLPVCESKSALHSNVPGSVGFWVTKWANEDDNCLPSRLKDLVCLFWLVARPNYLAKSRVYISQNGFEVQCPDDPVEENECLKWVARNYRNHSIFYKYEDKKKQPMSFWLQYYHGETVEIPLWEFSKEALLRVNRPDFPFSANMIS